jgi:hypothetical protein
MSVGKKLLLILLLLCYCYNYFRPHYRFQFVISCHRRFLPGTPLSNQRWSPPLWFQVSNCCTFLYHVWCSYYSSLFFSELLNVFPLWLPDFSLNLLLTFHWPLFYRYINTFHVPHSLHLYIDSFVSFFPATSGTTFLYASIVTSTRIISDLFPGIRETFCPSH